MTNFPTLRPTQQKKVQYSAALAITGVVKGSSREKIVSEVRTGISLSKKIGKKIVLCNYILTFAVKKGKLRLALKEKDTPLEFILTVPLTIWHRV